jgi:hypothetical protein
MLSSLEELILVPKRKIAILPGKNVLYGEFYDDGVTKGAKN